jgi:hypothetical protein
MAAHRGLSQAFVDKVTTIETARSVSGFALREGDVYVVRAAESTPEIRAALISEGIHHLLLVPVEGKNSPVGMFVLGMPRFRAYTSREKKFLKVAAKQLGMAAENRKLLQQLVHSRNEWASTFDSIPDCILVWITGYCGPTARCWDDCSARAKKWCTICARTFCQAPAQTGADVLTVRMPNVQAKKIRALADIPWFPPRRTWERTSPASARCT